MKFGNPTDNSDIGSGKRWHLVNMPVRITMGLSALLIAAAGLAACGSSGTNPHGHGQAGTKPAVQAKLSLGAVQQQLESLKGYQINFNGTGAVSPETLSMQVDAKGNTEGSITLSSRGGSMTGSFSEVNGTVYVSGNGYAQSIVQGLGAVPNSEWVITTPTQPDVVNTMTRPVALASCIVKSLTASSFHSTGNGTYVAKGPNGTSLTVTSSGPTVTSVTWNNGTGAGEAAGCPASQSLIPVEAPLVGNFTIKPAAVAPVQKPGQIYSFE